MNYQKNYIKIFLKGICVSVTFFLLGISFVNADSPRLEVVFNPKPLFEKLNFLPGDNTSGTITVTNNSGESQQIITESINGIDPDGLGSALKLRIFKNNVPDFYNNSLGDFLSSAGEVSLSALSDGETAVYTYEVIFGEDVEEYQNATLGFDICVGFEDENGRACGNTVIGDDEDDEGDIITGSGGGGGGGIYHSVPLVVENEDLIEPNIPSGTATITWNTNLLSTSQVVYGSVSDGPYVLVLADDDTGPTYLGYPLWTAENPIKVTSHNVLLTGLIDGETYKFRVVSRASPPTIGFEYVFEFRESEKELIIDETGTVVGFTDITPSVVLAGGVKPEVEKVKNTMTTTSSREVAKIEDRINENNSNSNLASILFAFPDFSSKCIIYFFLILIIIYLLNRLWNKFIRKNKEDSFKKDLIFWLVGVAVASFITYLLSSPCVGYSLAIFFVVLVIWYIISYFSDKKRM